jgi:membrane-bound ClpP family serine protease
MNTRPIVAVILVILGVAALGYSGIAFTTPGEAVDFRGLRVLQHPHHHFIPQVFGALALVGGGIILLFVKPKQGW